MEGRRVPAQLIEPRLALLAVLLAGCGRDEPTVPPFADRWARDLIARPIAEVCSPGEVADFASRTFCAVRKELVSGEVRALGANYIMLERSSDDTRYINLDWGGGHVDAYGVILGPVGWSHRAEAERKERKLRDGVFRYDTRQ